MVIVAPDNGVFWKTCFPMVSKPSFRLISFKDLLFPNARSWIVFTVLGIRGVHYEYKK